MHTGLENALCWPLPNYPYVSPESDQHYRVVHMHSHHLCSTFFLLLYTSSLGSISYLWLYLTPLCLASVLVCNLSCSFPPSCMPFPVVEWLSINNCDLLYLLLPSIFSDLICFGSIAYCLPFLWTNSGLSICDLIIQEHIYIPRPSLPFAWAYICYAFLWGLKYMRFVLLVPWSTSYLFLHDFWYDVQQDFTVSNLPEASKITMGHW